jgi:hypothetical protein
MPPRWFDRDEFYAELLKLGEDKVRDNLLSKVYGDVGNKRTYAEAWLAQRERARSEASNLEHLRIAKSANTAAWIAAISAIIAIICAIISIVISLRL